MEIEYDPSKNRQNRETHGLDFEDVPHLLWDDALVIEDTRQDYGEKRYRAFVRDKEQTAFSVAFTIRGSSLRIISFRRAHEKERKRYEER